VANTGFATCRNNTGCIREMSYGVKASFDYRNRHLFPAALKT